MNPETPCARSKMLTAGAKIRDEIVQIARDVCRCAAAMTDDKDWPMVTPMRARKAAAAMKLGQDCCETAEDALRLYKRMEELKDGMLPDTDRRIRDNLVMLRKAAAKARIIASDELEESAKRAGGMAE